MVTKRLSLGLVLCLCLLAPIVASGNAVITGTLEAFRVIEARDGEEQLLPADKASPKDVIEYRLTYTNTGDDAVQNVLITDPIPLGTEYVMKSATIPSWGRVEFSIDSAKSYHAWPIMIKKTTEDGTEVLVEATPEMVTHVRWVVEDAFQPERSVTVSYRTTVK